MRALASVGVTHLEQVTGFTEGKLLALHGMGPKAIEAIREALRVEGKGFAEEN